MKNYSRILFVLLLFACGANAQIIRPFTARYYNPSVKGNIVYVSNSIISTSGVGAGVPGTGEIPPTGTSRDNNGAGINIDVDNLANTIVFPLGTSWKWFSNGTEPAANWEFPIYNDAAWTTNNAEFGFGDGDEVTCLPSGGGGTLCNPTGNKYITYYFRKTVNIASLAGIASFDFDYKRDDGIVVYVNGTEIFRNNMPGGVIANNTLASSSIAGAGESTVYTYTLAGTGPFVAGNNVVAVEIHNSAANNVDITFDMGLEYALTDVTFNSSTADLTIPTTCNQVMFAGLYWGADQGISGTNNSWITGAYNQVQLKIPGSLVYQTITSTQTDLHSAAVSPGLPHTGYLCFADITSIINTTNANGTYTVGNVVGPIGINNSCGGWTLVIAYSNASLLPRNLTVFDGSVIINMGDPPVDVNIAGFLTPPSGPVSCELGAVVYDGDRGSTDSFSFRQNGAPAFYNLATTVVPFNANNDAWNSKITYKNTLVTTRNPAFNNTLGYDASIFDLPNAANTNLSNSQTSATVRFSSPGENYFVHVLTTSISQYNPSFVFDKTATDVNGGLLVPGDVIRYQVNYSNVGNDSSTNTIIYDNIPLGSTFVPGSIRINGVARTDAAGDDQAEYDFTNNRVVLRVGNGANATTGGNIGPGISGNITFNVVTASSCDILACSGSLRNEARISYNGKRSGDILYDSSGVSTSGCIIKGPVISPVSGSCFSPKDTLLVVRCPVLSVTLPYTRYAGYTFYSGMPFIPANSYNPFIPVTSSGVYWAYFDGGSSCSDTARVQVIITPCPDIDDDDDGIPDYVEFDNPLALQDHNSNGIPNWNDPAYPGFVDLNSDGYNDNFDWGADSDNDGIPNFQDTGFWTGWLDINADGVNDLSDKDLDGLPNQYDRDSDNDGIPDVVESYGVDENGDGLIDNYTETDYDGFSQNVDANNTGVNASGIGLGAPDLDGDGIPNYLDLDSDNDGIPDAIEVGAPDANNDGKPDGFIDNNGNGLHDSYELLNGLLFTGPDISTVDGRADNFPFKNKDRDFMPNAYDLDSDGDGITDVIEAGLPDADYNGRIDGAIGTNGWATVVSSLPALGLRFTDADPYPDYLDIDSDDDGIPDNIEGQTTAGYLLPGTTDTDGDGIENTYDNFAGFGGSGIFVYDHDADATPDYRDLDTDADGLGDIFEGNDFNLNGIPDDDVTLTGIDTDGDGLDNKFDSLNSVINIKGTSYRMGNGGSFAGDPAPGSRTTVQRTQLSQTDRDWRFVGFVLPVHFLQFSGSLQNKTALLSWTIIADKEIERFEIERSTDNQQFSRVATLSFPVILQVQQSFSGNDDVSDLQGGLVYYRLKAICKSGETVTSNVILFRLEKTKPQINIKPNPAVNYVQVSMYAETEQLCTIKLIESTGKVVYQQNHQLSKGFNSIDINSLGAFENGMYALQVIVNNEVVTKKLVISK